MGRRVAVIQVETETADASTGAGDDQQVKVKAKDRQITGHDAKHERMLSSSQTNTDREDKV